MSVRQVDVGVRYLLNVGDHGVKQAIGLTKDFANVTRTTTAQVDASLRASSRAWQDTARVAAAAQRQVSNEAISANTKVTSSLERTVMHLRKSGVGYKEIASAARGWGVSAQETAAAVERASARETAALDRVVAARGRLRKAVGLSSGGRSAETQGIEHGVVRAAAGHARAGASYLGGGLVGGIAAFAGVQGIKDAVNNTKELAKETQFLTQVTGMDTRTAAEWAAVAQSRGVQANGLNVAFRTLSKVTEAALTGSGKQAATTSAALSKVADAALTGNKKAIASFADLGISTADVSKRQHDMAALTDLVTSRLGKMRDGVQKTAVATSLLGKTAAVSTAAGAFKKLGISQQEVQQHSHDLSGLMGIVADKLNLIHGGAEKAALMAQLFGRNAAALLPILREGSKGMEEQRKQAAAYGVTLGGNAAANANKLREASENLKLAQIGLEVQFTEHVAPALMKVIGGGLKLYGVFRQDLGPAFHFVSGEVKDVSHWLGQNKDVMHDAEIGVVALTTAFVGLKVISTVVRIVRGLSSDFRGLVAIAKAPLSIFAAQESESVALAKAQTALAEANARLATSFDAVAVSAKAAGASEALAGEAGAVGAGEAGLAGTAVAARGGAAVLPAEARVATAAVPAETAIASEGPLLAETGMFGMLFGKVGATNILTKIGPALGTVAKAGMFGLLGNQLGGMLGGAIGGKSGGAIGSAVGTGAGVGFAVGGPLGAGIGAGAGLLGEGALALSGVVNSGAGDAVSKLKQEIVAAANAGSGSKLKQLAAEAGKMSKSLSDVDPTNAKKLNMLGSAASKAAGQLASQGLQRAGSAVAGLQQSIAGSKFTPGVGQIGSSTINALKNVPAQAQKLGAESMIQFTAGLEKNKRLPVGSTQKLIAAMEAQYGPGLKRMLIQDGADSMAAFSAQIKQSKVINAVQAQVDAMHREWGLLIPDVKVTSGNIVSVLTADMARLKTLFHTGPEAQRKDAIAAYNALKQQAVADFEAMGAAVAAKQAAMTSAIASGSKSAAVSATQNFGQFQTSVENAMASGVLTTSQGSALIAQAVNSTLKSFGAAQVPVVQGVSASQAKAAVTSSQTNIGPAAANAPHKQGGGYFSGPVPGDPTRDGTLAWLSGDEFVMTGPGQQMMHSYAPGLLGHIAANQAPHFRTGGPASAQQVNAATGASSGPVVLDAGVNMSVGQEPQILSDLHKLAAELGKTVYVISGYRTPAHSVAVGGFANDPHTKGEAADIGVGSASRASMAGVTDAQLRAVGLYRPFSAASEINHVQLTGGGGSFTGALAGAVSTTSQAVTQTVAQIANLVVKGNGTLPRMVQAGLNKETAAANKYVQSKAPTTSSTAGGGVSAGAFAGQGGSASANQTLGHQMMLAAGFPEADWPSLQALWTQESGWNANAVNSSSGAYGIPQSLGHGHPYALGDAAAQIAWGLNYIKGRYGNPIAAEQHERSFNWYRKGGRVIPRFASGGAVAYRVNSSDESDGGQGAFGFSPGGMGYSSLSASGSSSDAGTAGAALGHPQPPNPLYIKYGGKVVRATLQDIGAGSDSNHPTIGIYPSARAALGDPGNAVVDIERVDGRPFTALRGTPIPAFAAAGITAGTTAGTTTTGSTSSTKTTFEPAGKGLPTGVGASFDLGYLYGVDPTTGTTPAAALATAIKGAQLHAVKTTTTTPSTSAKTPTGTPTTTAGGALGKMIAQASAIASHNYNYEWGGGHNSSFAPTHGTGHGSGPGIGFDCSGAVSSVLHAGGLLGSSETSGQLMGYGASGPGKDVTIYAGPSHTFMKLQGRYFGTSGQNKGGGANWIPSFPENLPAIRHPSGFRRGGSVGKRFPGLPRREQARLRTNPMAILPGLRRGGHIPRFASGGWARGRTRGLDTPITGWEGSTRRGLDVHISGRSSSPTTHATGPAVPAMPVFPPAATYTMLTSLEQVIALIPVQAIDIGVDTTKQQATTLIGQLRRLPAPKGVYSKSLGKISKSLGDISHMSVKQLDAMEKSLGTEIKSLSSKHQGHLGPGAIALNRTDAKTLEGVLKVVNAAKATATAASTITTSLNTIESTPNNAKIKTAMTNLAGALGNVDAVSYNKLTGTAKAIQKRIDELGTTVTRHRVNVTLQRHGGGPREPILHPHIPPGLSTKFSATLARKGDTWATGRHGKLDTPVGPNATVETRVVTHTTHHELTAGEKRQQTRLEQALQLVNVEEGKRVGTIVNVAEAQVAAIAKGQTALTRLLQTKGIDQASAQGTLMLLAYQNQTVTVLKSTVSDLQKAYKMAAKAGDSKAVADIGTKLAAAIDQLDQAVADQISDRRAAVEAIAQQAVDAAAHGTNLAQAGEQSVQLKQQLHGTAGTPGAAAQLAAYIRGQVVPALTHELTALMQQEAAAKSVGDTTLATQIAEAIAAKQNDIDQAKVDALTAIQTATQQTAQNTQNLAGQLGVSFENETFPDLATSMNGA